MLTAIARRLLLSLLTLLALMVFVFIATEIMPGDALDVVLSADEVANMPPERLAKMKHDLGLDKPAPQRLATFLGGAVQGDFGRTLISKAPVSAIVAYPLRNSLALAVVVLLVALPLALVIGIASAYWHRRGFDNVASTAAIVGYSIPEFVMGTLLVIVFAVMLRWSPATITVDTRGPLWELRTPAARSSGRRSRARMLRFRAASLPFN